MPPYADVVPRQLRIEYENAIYHLINRGDRREPIFRDDFDHEQFVATLGGACEKTGWQIHAFCLMGNHFHLVVETPQANLVSGMKWPIWCAQRRRSGSGSAMMSLARTT